MSAPVENPATTLNAGKQGASAPLSSGAADFRPTFVVGCERSGTTLLAVMIGRHTSIAMMPETHFFLRVVPRRLRALPLTHSQILKRYYKSPRASDIDLDRGELERRFNAMPPTCAALFETILSMYTERWGKARGAEKTPFHLLCVPLILKWFPEARIVGIVRDGRDVVRSIMNAPWTAHRSLRRHCWKWARSAKLSRRLARKYPRNFHLIRYEELVLQPEKTLHGVDAFLGIPFEAGQLQQTGDPTGVVPDRERGWKGNAIERPDASRIGKWASKVTPHERLVMNSLMGPELREFGYDQTQLPEVSTWTRLINGTKNNLCKIGMYRLWGNICRYLPAERKRRLEGKRQQEIIPASDDKTAPAI